MWKPFLIVFSLLLAMPAWASSPDEARALIVSGDYVAARQMAESLETAEGYALAAESLSAQILLGEVDKLNRRAKEARELSEKALILDPSFYDAKLQYALADGFVTRTSGNVTAWRKKLPMKTLGIIQSFRAEHPDDARGLALEGAWHLGVIRKAGLKNGGKWFGASFEEGKRLYRDAILADPNDILIRANYFMALQVLNKELPVYSKTHNRASLEKILALSAETDIEEKTQARMREVLENLDDPKTMRKLAEKFLDGR